MIFVNFVTVTKCFVNVTISLMGIVLQNVNLVLTEENAKATAATVLIQLIAFM